MIRVVLTCLLAVAIAGVVFPAADAARADATTVKIGSLADDIAHAATTLSVVNGTNHTTRDSADLRLQ
ncbi:DUF7311 family protein, partial [Haloferax volcanii]